MRCFLEKEKKKVCQFIIAHTRAKRESYRERSSSSPTENIFSSISKAKIRSDLR